MSRDLVQTFDELLHAAKVAQGYGDLRPGYLEHESANLIGPIRRSSGIRRGSGAARSTCGVQGPTVVVSFDPATGEVRVTPKE
jgi:hypothetical protein